MYFQLGYDYPMDEEDGHYMLEDGVDFEGVKSWALGRPFTSPQLPDPINLNLVAIGEFKGEPPEMFDEYMCLMSAKMIDVLKKSGVDNLETYPAKLVDSTNERAYDYFAVNIIGMVAAADLGKSDWENLDGEAKIDTAFTSLVVKPETARGLPIFRLAESTGTILVHERIKSALEAGGFKTLRFSGTSG
jgi:hypothetical protein